MLAIRLQRTGRSGHAQFRVIVQDSHRSPTRGKIVAYLGSYDPHTKQAQIDQVAAQKFLDNGAQPSDRVVGLLKKEGVKIPAWVKVSAPGKRATRNPEKRRSTRPAEPEKPAEEAGPAEATEASAETPAPEPAEAPAEDKPAEQSTEEAASAPEPVESPADETPAEPEKPTEEAPPADEA